MSCLVQELDLVPLLPVRSQLYSPEPVGIGTGMVEALASYLARMAEAHLVSVPDLMRCLSSGATSNVPSNDHRIYNLMRLRSRELNGMQQTAQYWSTLIGQRTCRQGVDHLTLMPWRHIVTPRALTHPSQCWCPQCLDGWVDAGQPIYWPLVWSLRAVTVCAIHRISLEQRCHRCHVAVPSLTAQGRIGFCPKCGVWLGFEGRLCAGDRPVKDASGLTGSAVRTAAGALTLLSISSVIQESVAIDKLAGLLEFCSQSAGCRQVVVAKHLDMSPATLSRLLCRRRLVTVPTLLSALACLGLDTADFVQMPVETIASSGSLDDFIGHLPHGKGESVYPSRLRQGQRASPELLAEVQMTLEAALAEDDPPGLPTLAQRAGLTTVKILRAHYPHLCRAIMEKRKLRFSPQVARQVLTEIANSAATPPSLMTIASQLKTSPVTLCKYFPDEITAIKARRRTIQDVMALRHSVEAFLNEDPPLSLSEVSLRLGIKTYHIQKHCSDLKWVIVQRFAAYQHTCAVERERQSIAAVRRAVTKLDASGQFPTKSKVAALLGRTRRLILTPSESEAFSEMMCELGLWHR